MGRTRDIIKTEQDLTYLDWNEIARPSGLTGERAKAREGTGANAVFYKLRHPGELGRNYHDCFAELICSRLYRHLGIDHVSKQLVFAKIHPDKPAEWVVKSKSYRKPGERAVSLSVFHELQGLPGESPLDLCKRMGWSQRVWDMFMVDFITATRSRTSVCFEVIADRSGAYRLSPLIPRSFSLANSFPLQTWRVLSTADVGTYNYLGSNSLQENLNSLPDDYPIPRFSKRTCDELFSGLYEIAPDPSFLDASRTVLEKRWQLLEDVRNL